MVHDSNAPALTVGAGGLQAPAASPTVTRFSLRAGVPCYLDREIHLLQDEQSHVLYAPLKGVALVIAEQAAAWLRQLQRSPGLSLPAERSGVATILARLGLLRPEPVLPRVPSSRPDGPFLPTYVTLFLTGRCNLRCGYCYSFGGERPTTMPAAIATGAVDLVVRNAQSRSDRRAEVHFHGGGEPTQALSRMQEIVDVARGRAQAAAVDLRFTMGTNGVMSDDAIDWVIRSVAHATVSADGDAITQNRNRPLQGGGESFGPLLHTLERFDRVGFNYSLRMTLAGDDAPRLPALVRALLRVSRTKRIKVEPLFPFGRAIIASQSPPDPDVFVQGFCEAAAIAALDGRELSYSGCRPEVVTDRFCAAAGHSMCVTSAGEASACYEVTSPDDIRADRFFFGKWNESEQRFHFDEQKLEWLRNQTVDRFAHCSDCLAKWHCAGDCPAKTNLPQYQLVARPQHRTWRCPINRELTRRAVLARAAAGLDVRAAAHDETQG